MLFRSDAFTSEPEIYLNKLIAIWKQLGEHYKNAPANVGFELLNEPKDAATTMVMNEVQKKLIAEIRNTNPHRVLFVAPGRWNSIKQLPLLNLPADDNLIVTVHDYEPFYFTHQGAPWAGPEVGATGIKFPGPASTAVTPPDNLPAAPRAWLQRYNSSPAATSPCRYETIQADLQFAAEWSRYYGRPIHLGEFGAVIQADAVSRGNYYRTFREVAEKEGLGWANWDWKAGFAYWDDEQNQPREEMRKAFFNR